MIRHIRGEESGAAAVEFALVAIVLVMLLTGIVQFGFTFFQYLEVVHSAREGARWASLGLEEGSVADPDTVKGRVAAAAPGLSPGLTNDQIEVSQVTVGGQPAVTVHVEYSSPIFVPLIGDIVGGTGFVLESAATLRVE